MSLFLREYLFIYFFKDYPSEVTACMQTASHHITVLFLSPSSDRLFEPWIRTFPLPSSSQPSSLFCSSSTTGLCMIWLLVQLLSSDPGSDDAAQKNGPTITLNRHWVTICFLFKNITSTELRHLPFKVLSEHKRIGMVALSLRHTNMNCFNLDLLCFWHTHTVFLHVCLHAAFRIRSCARKKWWYLLSFYWQKICFLFKIVFQD